MKLVAEYRMYAEGCRKLAAKMREPEDIQALETMVRAWESAANQREAQLLKQIDLQTGVATQ